MVLSLFMPQLNVSPAVTQGSTFTAKEICQYNASAFIFILNSITLLRATVIVCIFCLQQGVIKIIQELNLIDHFLAEDRIVFKLYEDLNKGQP